MGKYITDAYTRVQCTLCGNRIVDIILPGTPFDSIKECPCQVEEVEVPTEEVEEVEVPTEEVEEVEDDLESLDIEEIKRIAVKNKIKFPKNIGKETLIKKIRG